MIRCQQCGTDNLDGSEYCDECGNRLSAAASVRAVPAPPPPVPPPPQLAPPPPPSFVREGGGAPKPATPYMAPPALGAPANLGNPLSNSTAVSNPTTVGSAANLTNVMKGATGPLAPGNNTHPAPVAQPVTAVALSNETTPIRGKLVIQRGGKIGKEFPLTTDESLIGRWDADGGIFPDVDLDQDDPEAKVSRRHARIQCFNNKFTIEDLGSTNGTFVNRGARLLPGNKHPLQNGDEIIVGKTFLKFVAS